MLAFVAKFPISISLAFSGIVGIVFIRLPALATIRHLVEGTFGYIDTILIIATAMVFMKVLEASGLLSTIARQIVVGFRKHPNVLLLFLMLFAMFPGMITGSSTVAVLTGGALVAPVFMEIGVPRNKTAAIIALAGIFGMIAPPVNIPAMIIGGGVDMPYVGFTIPLIVTTFPLAVIIVYFLGLKHVKKLKLESIKLPKGHIEEYGFTIYAPLIVLLVLLVIERVFPELLPSLGMPLIFLIGSVVGLFSGKRFNFLKVSRSAVEDALPVMGILAGVGIFVQIMTLTGARGLVVGGLTGLPKSLLYLSIAISMPLFGAVSAYGSASILGIPFILALLSQNQILVASALSLVAGLGDLMPPTALAGLFAAKVVEQDNYLKVLKYCLVPAALTAGYAIFVIAAPWW